MSSISLLPPVVVASPSSHAVSVPSSSRAVTTPSATPPTGLGVLSPNPAMQRALARPDHRVPYAQQFRAAIAPVVETMAIRLNSKKPSLPVERTRAAELQKWDAVLKDVYMSWPKEGGKLRTGMRSVLIIQRPVQFDDGPMDLRTILRHHWQAVQRFNKDESPASPIVHPASYFTQDYFLWALQRVSDGAEIGLDRVYNSPSDMIALSFHKPDLAKPGVAEAILREIWSKLSDAAKITNTRFQDRSGQSMRMIRVLEVYWRGLKARLVAEGKWTAHIPPAAHREQALQLMHLTLFGKAILRNDQTPYYVSLPMPILRYDTLGGIVRIADAMSQLPFVREARMFPSHHGHRKDVMVLADGTTLRYETVIERLTSHLAIAKVQGDPRVAHLKLDEVYVQMAREDMAALRVVEQAGGRRRDIVFRSRTVPNEATRKEMYEWVLRRQRSTVIRVPSGQRLRQAAPVPPETPRRERVFDPRNP